MLVDFEFPGLVGAENIVVGIVVPGFGEWGQLPAAEWMLDMELDMGVDLQGETIAAEAGCIAVAGLSMYAEVATAAE